MNPSTSLALNRQQNPIGSQDFGPPGEISNGILLETGSSNFLLLENGENLLLEEE